MMSEEAQENSSNKGGWLDRIGQYLQGEIESRDELIAIIEDVNRRGLIDKEACQIIKGALEVSEIKVRDVMIPRSQMTVVEWGASLEDFLPIIIESGHSRFPVIGEDRDKIHGILHAKDLLPYLASDRSDTFSMRELLRPALFVPESKYLNNLLREFRSSQNHMAIVADEYGGISGVITIEDVLEEIVGEIEDEFDQNNQEHMITPIEDSGAYLIEALTPITDFNNFFNLSLSDDEAVTVGGIVLNHFGRLPKKGEHFEIESYLLTVVKSDVRRVYQLRIEPSSEE